MQLSCFCEACFLGTAVGAGGGGLRLKASFRNNSQRDCCVRSQGSECSEVVKVRCLLGLLFVLFSFNFFVANIQMDCYYLHNHLHIYI